MRDIVWTLIVIWLVYKVVAIFKGNSSQKSKLNNSNFDQDTSFDNPKSSKEQKVNSAVKKHLNNEGEYIDFEEMK